MALEELGDENIDLWVFEAAVAAAFDGVQGRFHAGLLERVQKDFALVVRHERVLVAVDDQEGGIVVGNVCDGVGALALVLIFLDGAADMIDTIPPTTATTTTPPKPLTRS